jgi:superoxide dismutase, Fe-Mn family
MSDFTNKDIKENIKKSLGLEKDKTHLNESYVAQTKTFSLPTELLSSANKKAHIDLYEGYVAEFNKISAELDSVDRNNVNKNNSKFRSLKIDETYNGNAAYLHELYFANISDLHSEVAMDSLAYMRLTRDFGTFDDWQRDFMACCLASRNGWACTVYNVWLQSYQNCVIDLHSSNVPVGVFPVITLDMWEHAYYRDYLNNSKVYTVAMMKQLNWKVIETRVKKAEKIGQILRSST